MLFSYLTTRNTRVPRSPSSFHVGDIASQAGSGSHFVVYVVYQQTANVVRENSKTDDVHRAYLDVYREISRLIFYVERH